MWRGACGYFGWERIGKKTELPPQLRTRTESLPSGRIAPPHCSPSTPLKNIGVGRARERGRSVGSGIPVLVIHNQTLQLLIGIRCTGIYKKRPVGLWSLLRGKKRWPLTPKGKAKGAPTRSENCADVCTCPPIAFFPPKLTHTYRALNRSCLHAIRAPGLWFTCGTIGQTLTCADECALACGRSVTPCKPTRRADGRRGRTLRTYITPNARLLDIRLQRTTLASLQNAQQFP